MTCEPAMAVSFIICCGMLSIIWYNIGYHVAKGNLTRPKWTRGRWWRGR